MDESKTYPDSVTLSSNNGPIDTAATPQQGHSLPGQLSSKRWMQVIGAFFIFFNAWGLLLAFGTFEVYYEENLLSAYSRSDISWIATIAAFLLTVGGTFTGKMFDEGLMRPMLLVGSFLVVFGLMMTSLAHQYFQLFLAEGVCVGLGLSLLWVPALSAVALHFEGGLRAIAIGAVSAGSSLGGVLYPIIFSQLQQQIGFGWTVRIIAFLVLCTMVISLATMLPAKQPNLGVRRILDLSALTEWPFVMMMFSGFFVLLGYYVPIVYLPTYALTAVGGSDARTLAFYIVVIANAASCPSRIITGVIVGKTGPFPAYVLALTSSAVLLFAWIAVKSVAGIIVWTMLYGFMTGLVISIPGSIVPLLCSTPAVIGTRMGMAWFGAALGILVGSPIGGALVSTTTEGVVKWWPLQVFSGSAMLIGGLLCVPPWIYVSRRKTPAM